MHLIKRLLMALLILSAIPASAADLVREFRGSADEVTAEFSVTAPWLLEWRVGSDYPEVTGFELYLVDAVSRLMKGRILRIKRTGNGTKIFSDSGRFRFRVSSGFANWHLKVIELTREEAAEYVPSSQRPAEGMIRQR